MAITGKKIYLREVRQSDINDNYYNWLNDPDVNQFLEIRYYPHSKDHISAFVKSKDGNSNEILYAICDKETKLHIGNIKLGPINWIHRFADVSLLIGEKNYWGKGLASEAIKLVSDVAFKKLNLNKLKAGCYSKNLGSVKAFKKVGFELEGELKDHWILNGSTQNQLLLGFLSKDYFNKYGSAEK